ncbi:unnamed protein product, partial [Amoebophrya sp. A25]
LQSELVASVGDDRPLMLLEVKQKRRASFSSSSSGKAGKAKQHHQDPLYYVCSGIVRPPPAPGSNTSTPAFPSAAAQLVTKALSHVGHPGSFAMHKTLASDGFCDLAAHHATDLQKLFLWLLQYYNICSIVKAEEQEDDALEIGDHNKENNETRRIIEVSERDRLDLALDESRHEAEQGKAKQQKKRTVRLLLEYERPVVESETVAERVQRARDKAAADARARAEELGKPRSSFSLLHDPERARRTTTVRNLLDNTETTFADGQDAPTRILDDEGGVPLFYSGGKGGPSSSSSRGPLNPSVDPKSDGPNPEDIGDDKELGAPGCLLSTWEVRFKQNPVYELCLRKHWVKFLVRHQFAQNWGLLCDRLAGRARRDTVMFFSPDSPCDP